MAASDSNSDLVITNDKDALTVSPSTHPNRVHVDDLCGHVVPTETSSDKGTRGVAGLLEAADQDGMLASPGLQAYEAGPPQQS